MINFFDYWSAGSGEMTKMFVERLYSGIHSLSSPLSGDIFGPHFVGVDLIIWLSTRADY